MKHYEVIGLYNKLSKVEGLEGCKLNYAIKKNLSKLEIEINLYAKEEYELRSLTSEFQKEQSSLEKLFSKEEDKKEFENQITELENKHQIKLKEFKEKWEQLMKFRKENDNPDFVIHKVKTSDVPENITTEQMDLIFHILEE